MFGPSGFWTMAPLPYAAKFDFFPWIVPGWRVWERNPRKGGDQILQRSIAERSRAIVQKPKEPNTYELKIWL